MFYQKQKEVPEALATPETNRNYFYEIQIPVRFINTRFIGTYIVLIHKKEQ